MSNADTPCPRCDSTEVVKTAETLRIRLFFCLGCGRSFELPLPKPAEGMASRRM